ncbi:MAG: TrbC/VirB2 family protein [Sphingomonadales bacterium]|nr:TrbC/VirB2 family protein [Sphingomonadales bacterium]
MEHVLHLSLAFIASSDSAIPAAVQWLAGTLLGSVATGIAVLAIAFVGFGLLGGRLNWRTGARVVMGVFILFGAPMIAQELMSLARDGDASTVGQVATTPIPPSPQVPANAPVYDPYAGAAVPR